MTVASPTVPRPAGRPAKQSRSQETRAALLAAGHRLFATAGVEATSISGIAAAAGVSIGAFYHHFESKDAFYLALLEATIAEVWVAAEATLRDSDLAGRSHGAVLAVWVRFMTGIFRNHQGLLRAAQRKAMDEPSAWDPIRAIGRALTDLQIETLRRHGHLAAEGSREGTAGEERMRIAAQVLNSTLLTAIQHRAGPLYVEEARTARELTDVVCRYLGVEPPPTGLR